MRRRAGSARIIGVLALASVLAGCASMQAQESARRERLAALDAFIAAEALPSLDAESFGLRQRWTPIDDAHLVVWKHDREPVLLTVAEPCLGLRYAQAIRLSGFGSLRRVRRGVDYVEPLPSLGTRFDGRHHPTPRLDSAPVERCRIVDMHGMTTGQLEALQRLLRAH